MNELNIDELKMVRQEAHDHIVQAMALLVRADWESRKKGASMDTIFDTKESDEEANLRYHKEAIATITKCANDLYDGPIQSMASWEEPKCYNEVFPVKVDPFDV